MLTPRLSSMYLHNFPSFQAIVPTWPLQIEKVHGLPGSKVSSDCFTLQLAKLWGEGPSAWPWDASAWFEVVKGRAADWDVECQVDQFACGIGKQDMIRWAVGDGGNSRGKEASKDPWNDAAWYGTIMTQSYSWCLPNMTVAEAPFVSGPVQYASEQVGVRFWVCDAMPCRTRVLGFWMAAAKAMSCDIWPNWGRHKTHQLQVQLKWWCVATYYTYIIYYLLEI